ncbi:MAG: DUF2459 domain-containing protein [Phycisphaeraceae bacterium]|nr:MAG: DUF2459 domain-containing protein [Phycisphaeraceae bacterium]
MQRESNTPTRRRRLRRFALIGVAVVTVCGIALAAVGCGATIKPPADPSNPATVYIIDYGRHTSLVLPRESGEHVEYSYGEWSWYAKNRTGALHVFRTLLIPSQGALGRRIHDGPPEEEALRREFVFDRIRPIIVEAEATQALVNRLDERFEEGLDTLIYNELHDLRFVHDPDRYTFFNNCNPVLASWLRELGCEVRGPALLAHWRIEEPEPG